MLQITNTKMSVWNAQYDEKQRNTIKAVGSTCKKVPNLETGEVQYAYQNWNIFFKGNAYHQAMELILTEEERKEKHPRILLKKGVVENVADGNGGRYVWCTIFEFETLQ